MVLTLTADTEVGALLMLILPIVETSPPASDGLVGVVERLRVDYAVSCWSADAETAMCPSRWSGQRTRAGEQSSRTLDNCWPFWSSN